MSSRKEHCRECTEKLGKPYNEVHAWFDGLACINGMLDLNHRRHRHHADSLNEIRRMFGEDAVEAAKLHLIADFGRIPTRQEVEDMFPEEPELISFDRL